MPSSSYEPFKSNENVSKQGSSCQRSRRRSPPTDSDDEDPFHFDNILSSPPSMRDESPRKAISSSLFRHASIVPVDPSATPAPHRFSLLRERASEGTIFVQEICDAEGQRWSLRVPASGLPEDMVSMLEELEKLALELGQALPRIVVTCSAESLSSKRAALTSSAAGSAELLQPPPPTDVNAIGGGYSLAKEKSRLVEREPEPAICEAEPTKSSASSSSIAASSPSEQSLTCIYLPEVSAPSLLVVSPSDTLSSHISWRPSFCLEVQPLPFCSPQTASTVNLPRSTPRTPVPRDSEPSSPRSETAGSPRAPRAAVSPGVSQQQQEPQPQSSNRSKPKPKLKCNRIRPFPRRPDPVSR